MAGDETWRRGPGSPGTAGAAIAGGTPRGSRAKSSYRRCCAAAPGAGRRRSGSAAGKRPATRVASKNCWPTALAFWRAATAGARRSSMSRTAFSVAAFSITVHPTCKMRNISLMTVDLQCTRNTQPVA